MFAAYDSILKACGMVRPVDVENFVGSAKLLFIFINYNLKTVTKNKTEKQKTQHKNILSPYNTNRNSQLMDLDLLMVDEKPADWIDPVALNEKEIYEALLKKAYGENYPRDAYDFPAGSILIPADQNNSDYHIQFNYQLGSIPNDLSVHDHLCPPVAAQPKVSKKNRNPVTHVPALTDVGTTFGKALRSFVELLVYVEHYGKATTHLRRFFCTEWGIPLDTDFEPLLPQVAGTGSSKFATLGRHLDPESEYNSALAATLDVVSHDVTRRSWTKDKLVDWTRIQNIIRTVGVFLLEDGYTGKRFDFQINHHILPDAVTDIQWDDDWFDKGLRHIPDPGNTRTLNNILKNTKLVKKVEQIVGDVSVPSKLCKTLDNLHMADFEERVKKNVDIVELRPNSDGFPDIFQFDIVEPRKPINVEYKPKVEEKKPYKTNPHERIAEFLNRIGVFNEKDRMGTFDVLGYHGSEVYPDFAVDAVLNKRVLSALRLDERLNVGLHATRFEQFMFYGRALGFDLKDARDDDLDRVIARNRAKKHVRKECFNIYILAANKFHQYRIRHNVLDREVFEHIRKNHDVVGGLNKFIQIRKRYWKRHYIAKSRVAKLKYQKVMNQQLAANFSVIMVRLDDGPYFNDPRLKNNLLEAASNYVRKKGKNRKKDEVDLQIRKFPNPAVHTLNNFLVELDQVVQWEVGSVLVVNTLRSKALKLYADCACLFHSFKGDVDELDLVDQPDPPADDVITQPPEELAKVEPQTVLNEPAPVANFVPFDDAGDDPFGDMEFGDFNEEAAAFSNKDQRLAVQEILDEMTLVNPSAMYNRVVSKFGVSVPFEWRVQVMDFVKSTNGLDFVNNDGPRAPLGGFDIIEGNEQF